MFHDRLLTKGYLIKVKMGLGNLQFALNFNPGPQLYSSANKCHWIQHLKTFYYYHYILYQVFVWVHLIKLLSGLIVKFVIFPFLHGSDSLQWMFNFAIYYNNIFMLLRREHQSKSPPRLSLMKQLIQLKKNDFILKWFVWIRVFYMNEWWKMRNHQLLCM